MEKIRYERELAEPLRRYLSEAGFEVRCEVNACDLVARRPDRLVVVEMKRHLSFDLLAQAVERQGYADTVYVAIPKPAGLKLDKDWRARIKVLRQLGLGLFLVSRAGEAFLVEEALAPEPPQAIRSRPKKRRSLEKEFSGRRIDLNTGGSRGVPLVTAYREAALLVAHLLEIHGPMPPKALRGLGSDPKRTTSILRLNPYHWFARGDNHHYHLTDSGSDALQTYAPLVALFSVAAPGNPAPADAAPASLAPASPAPDDAALSNPASVEKKAASKKKAPARKAARKQPATEVER